MEGSCPSTWINLTNNMINTSSSHARRGPNPHLSSQHTLVPGFAAETAAAAFSRRGTWQLQDPGTRVNSMNQILSNPVQFSFPEFVVSGQRLKADTPYDPADLHVKTSKLIVARYWQFFKISRRTFRVLHFFKWRWPVGSCYKTSRLYLSSQFGRDAQHTSDPTSFGNLRLNKSL